MKKLVLSFFSALVFVPLMIVACDGASETEEAEKRFEEACTKSCEKFAEANCGNFVEADQCDTGCSFLERELDGICVEEYTELYECSAELEYTCMNGTPYPTDLDAAAKCTEPSLALSECLQGVECKKFCRAAKEAGCGGASEDLCVQDCEAARPSDSFCDFDYDNLRECQAEDMSCSNGKPSTAGCEYEKDSLVECLGDFGDGSDPCAGYCFLALDEGCATGGAAQCKSECMAVLTQDVPGGESCSYEFDNLRSCETDGLSCQAGKPVVEGVDCSYQVQQIGSCLRYVNICLASCWTIESQSCATGDLSACQAACDAEMQVEPNCQYEFENLKGCQIDQNVVCDPGSTACQYEQDSYQSCAAAN